MSSTCFSKDIKSGEIIQNPLLKQQELPHRSGAGNSSIQTSRHLHRFYPFFSLLPHVSWDSGTDIHHLNSKG
ncbi:hypothetical protein ACFS7Z_13400 [Pontibacter toksunensis]|uniref:Uncharacterized protein n=1 Tax=Pontibacter toksunensis TaxID=1332631 RepID=A0ABW6BUB7_9BACT